MKKSLQLKNGQMQIIGIMFLALILIFSTTIFTKIKYFIQFGSASTAKEQARHVAEAGIDKAIWEIASDPNYDGEPYPGIPVDPLNPAAGTFTIIVEKVSGQPKRLTSEGYIPNSNPLQTKAKQKIQIAVEPAGILNQKLMAFVQKNHAAVVNFEPDTFKSYVYALGGTDGGTGCEQDNIVQYAPIINPDNPLGPWQGTTKVEEGALPLPVIFHSATAVNGYIYVIGGQYIIPPDDTCITKETVYFAKPQNGQIAAGGWSTTANLPYPLDSHTSFSANNRIYVIGGVEQNPSEIPSKKIYFAEPNPDGTLGNWQQNSPDLPEPRHSMGTAYSSLNQYVYIVGGNAYLFGGYEANTVYYAPVNAGSGTVGPFIKSTNKLPFPLWDTDSVVVGNYLYVLGGVRPTCYGCKPRSVTVPDVYFARLNSDGSLDTPFSKSINSLPAPYGGGAAVVVGNDVVGYKIYYLGGHVGNNITGNVWSTDVDLATGEIGPWTDNGAPITYLGWGLNKSTYIAK